MKKYLTPSLIILLLPLAPFAQSQTTIADEVEVVTRLTLWEFQSPQGHYLVNLNTVQSISMATYIVDGLATVYEVNVGTSSPMQARFYHIEPITPQVSSQVAQHAINTARSRLEQLQGRVDKGDLAYTVQKKHPETTHAKTVEYRLRSKADLDRLYTSLTKAFRSQRPRSVKFYLN